MTHCIIKLNFTEKIEPGTLFQENKPTITKDFTLFLLNENHANLFTVEPFVFWYRMCPIQIE